MITHKNVAWGLLAVGAAVAPQVVSADVSPEQSALENAQALKDYYQDVYDQAAGADVANLGSQLNTQKTTVANTRAAVRNANTPANTSYTNKLSLSKLWISSYKTFTNPASSPVEKQTALNTLAGITKNEMKNNKFNKGNLDTAKKYDPSNLPPEMVDKMNTYFVQLINSVHVSVDDGGSAFYNTNAQQFADQVANKYEAQNYLGNIEHNVPAINSVASGLGLRTNSKLNLYENLTSSYVSSVIGDKYSEADLMEMVYTAATSFTIEDSFSSFAHTEGLLRQPTMGLSISKVTSEGWEYLQIHVEGVTEQLVTDGQYESKWGINSAQTKRPNQALADAQVAYNNAQKKLADLQQQYTITANKSQFASSEAAESLASANAALSSAQAAYNAYLAAHGSDSGMELPESNNNTDADSEAAVQSSLAAAQSSLASYQSSVEASQASYQSSVAASLSAAQSSLASYQSSVSASLSAAQSEAAQQQSIADSIAHSQAQSAAQSEAARQQSIADSIAASKAQSSAAAAKSYADSVAASKARSSAAEAQSIANSIAASKAQSSAAAAKSYADSVAASKAQSAALSSAQASYQQSLAESRAQSLAESAANAHKSSSATNNSHELSQAVQVRLFIQTRRWIDLAKG